MLRNPTALAVFLYLRRLITGWVLWYVTVCFLLGGTTWAKPAWRFAAAGWAVALTSWQLHKRKRISAVGSSDEIASPRGHALFHFGELVLTNIAFTLLLAEVSLQAYAAASGRSLLISNTLDAHRLIPGYDYGHGLKGNSLGYPGKDYPQQMSPGVFRIAALGDSFAVGPAVAFSDNYLTLLEQQLSQTEVLNFGVSGAGPREYLTILEEDVWRFEPDLVLVSIFAGNDITEMMATPRHLHPERHALYLFCSRIWKLCREKSRRQPIDSNPAVDRLSAPPLSRKTFLDIEARRLQVCRKPLTGSMTRRWNRTFHYLEEFIEACRDRNVAVAFLIIPDEFQVDPRVLADACKRASLDPADLDITVPQRKLATFFNKHQTPFLDLLPLFRGRTDAYAPLDTHWNAPGNHLAADALSTWLRESILHAPPVGNP